MCIVKVSAPALQGLIPLCPSCARLANNFFISYTCDVHFAHKRRAFLFLTYATCIQPISNYSRNPLELNLTKDQKLYTPAIGMQGTRPRATEALYLPPASRGFHLNCGLFVQLVDNGERCRSKQPRINRNDNS